jgi:hypothetical protein
VAGLSLPDLVRNSRIRISTPAASGPNPPECAASPARKRRRNGSTLPARMRGIHQPQVRFVHKRNGLQRVARPPVGHVTPRQAMQLVIDQRHKLLDCALVDLAPRPQQLRDLVGGWLPSAGAHLLGLRKRLTPFACAWYGLLPPGSVRSTMPAGRNFLPNDYSFRPRFPPLFSEGICGSARRTATRTEKKENRRGGNFNVKTSGSL